MKKLALFALAVTLMLMGCKKDPITPDEPTGSPFGRALRSLDIVSRVDTIIPEENPNGFTELYQVFFNQPVDHNNPAAGTFEQKAYVFYVGSERPTVLYTCGYTLYERYKKYATYSNALIVDMLDNFIPNTTCPILFVYAKDDPWTGARPDLINEQYSRMVINPIGVHNHDLNNVEHFTPEMKQDIMDFIARYVPYGDDPVVAKRSPYSHYVEMDDKFMIRK